MPLSVLVVGCGFIGLPLARRFAESGCHVSALTLSDVSAIELNREAFPVLAVDIRARENLLKMPKRAFDIVIHTASSGRGGADAYQQVFYGGIINLRSTLDFGHLIFTSSTSVYAQMDGSLVDEGSFTDPRNETGRILLRAEKAVLDSAGTVARMAGLYGPGRCVPLQRLRAGKALLDGAGERIMNMLYQSDAVSGLLLLAEKRCSGIFNLVDDEPVSQLEWFQYVCSELGLPLPPVGVRDLNRKRGWSSKRVSNGKLRALGWRPGITNFRVGIRDILDHESKEAAKGSLPLGGV
ncbi:MAG: NAD-dependent epimerase/dehydratase family protein [Verrucomicrobia bacterium]|nr:NAD-dependent epimerase/dehydratase family protein [Verrucomicrobiota bacterium]MBV9673738.1 NAD-dependent epimerase/dehydratase family protein [Verrucomicrobiota bacterium]